MSYSYIQTQSDVIDVINKISVRNGDFMKKQVKELADPYLTSDFVPTLGSSYKENGKVNRSTIEFISHEDTKTAHQIIIPKMGINKGHINFNDDQYIKYYHDYQPLYISVDIVKNPDKPYFIKYTYVMVKDPNETTSVNAFGNVSTTIVDGSPKCSHIFKSEEIFTDDGRKVYERAVYKKNNGEKTSRYDEEFDYTIESVSFLENDETTGEYREVSQISDTRNGESLLIKPIGESSEKTLQPIKITGFNPDENLTNYTSIINDRIVSGTESEDEYLPDEMFNRQKRCMQFVRDTYQQNAAGIWANIIGEQ